MAVPAEVRETHSATVVFIGDRAYKVKKPLDLGFADFRSLAARRAVCHREVELNRRLAPDVYLGVADVHGPDGAVCEHLVVMRRMPADRRLSDLVRSGAPVDEHLRHVAHALAALHAGSPRSALADEEAGAAATRRRWRTNTTEMLASEPAVLDAARVEEVQAAAERYLRGREPLFAARVADGRGVDGHGDLLADDIFCLDDGPRILDCLEFDDRLRVGDGLADAAFLAMDLERLGRPDLGRRFLDVYQDHRGDVWPRSLAHHHVAYRAQVRAKVGAIRARQGDAGEAAGARDLLELAARHLHDGRVRLVLVGGLPGTGKTTLANGLANQLGLVLLRSDEVRKDLAGIPIDAPAPARFEEGIYSRKATEDTYTRLLQRAAVALRMGETVVLDASWTSEDHRSLARALARATSSELIELRCDAPAATTRDRILQRLRQGTDASDATPAIARELERLDAVWPQAARIDTSGSAADALAAALEHLDGAPG